MSGSKRLEGRAAFITGARQGIGRAIAEAFAAEGAALFLFDLSAELLPEIAEAAQAQGVRAHWAAGDVTDPDAVEAAMAAAEAALGHVDVLVNGAGIFQTHSLAEYPLDQWRRLMDVNVTGTLICTQAALKRMAPRSFGRILNLASAAGKLGGAYRAAYNTSKHAVIGLTRCTAVELASQGITANAICPGMVDTAMFDALVRGVGALRSTGGQPSNEDAFRAELLARAPISRMIRPEEIASLAVYLASDDAAAITGQAVSLDGGVTMT